MEKRGVSLCIFLFLLIFMGANPISSQSNNQLPKISNQVLNNLNQEDQVEIIISLNITNKSILEEINESFNVTSISQTKPSLTLIVDKEDLSKLNNLSYVKKIIKEPEFRTSLQDSVNIINASKTWKLRQDNLNLTGLGQTICIIDSGVNYSHSDFGSCTTSQLLSGNCEKVIGGYAFYNPKNSSNPNDIMGDSDHGTHVAGIIAADGTIKGIAPEAKLVILKACGPTSSCDSQALLDSLNWCVNNASVFNISVISISIGTTAVYTDYCDSEWTDLTDAINSAVAKNISVVVAASNDGSSTSIALPACIRNSTPVGSTTELDAISNFSNRNWLVKLFAPGSEINSTILSGGYGSLSGTSMATPHVSGAIALLKQYLQLTSRTNTTKQIETIFFNTGKLFSEGSNNFSRINVYNAIISQDNQNPNITLISPNNSILTSDSNQTFRCNATDLSLKNVTFYLWNSTSLYNQTSYNISGSSYNLEINLTNLPEENYKWNCLGVDENSNYIFYNTNYTLTLGGVLTALSYPINSTYTNISRNNFSCNSSSPTSYNLVNVTFYLWNSTSLVYNETKIITGQTNSSSFNYSFTQEENYKWNCLSENNNSNVAFSSTNYSIVYDSTPSNITLISPSASYSDTTSSKSFDFQFNVSDTNLISNCSLIISGDSNYINFNLTINKSLTNVFSKTLSSGSYNWYVNCLDLSGNSANSETRTIILTTPEITTSSGGGGGGGGTVALPKVITNSQMQQGYTEQLTQSSKLTFQISSQSHTITTTKISGNNLEIIIRSDPINLTLFVGQEIKLSINSSDYYNLYLKLNSILNNKANLTIKEINERIIVNATEGMVEDNESNQEVSETPEITKDVTKNDYIIYLIILFVIFLLIVYYIIRQFRINKQKNIRRINLSDLKK